jgi:hypothetical protein
MAYSALNDALHKAFEVAGHFSSESARGFSLRFKDVRKSDAFCTAGGAHMAALGHEADV